MFMPEQRKLGTRHSSCWHCTKRSNALSSNWTYPLTRFWYLVKSCLSRTFPVENIASCKEADAGESSRLTPNSSAAALPDFDEKFSKAQNLLVTISLNSTSSLEPLVASMWGATRSPSCWTFSSWVQGEHVVLAKMYLMVKWRDLVQVCWALTDTLTHQVTFTKTRLHWLLNQKLAPFQINLHQLHVFLWHSLGWPRPIGVITSGLCFCSSLLTSFGNLRSEKARSKNIVIRKDNQIEDGHSTSPWNLKDKKRHQWLSKAQIALEAGALTWTRWVLDQPRFPVVGENSMWLQCQCVQKSIKSGSVSLRLRLPRSKILLSWCRLPAIVFWSACAGSIPSASSSTATWSRVKYSLRLSNTTSKMDGNNGNCLVKTKTT